MARPREFDETEVLDRAVDVFWEHGFDGTSISDLEAATGIGRQSLYNAFGGKREIFLRALDRYAALNRERDVGTHGQGLEALRSFLRESAAALTEGGRGCFITKSLLEDPRSEDVAVRCGVSADLVFELARGWLTEALHEGALRDGLDPELGARIVSTHAHGISAASAAGVDRSELEAGIDWLVDSFASR